MGHHIDRKTGQFISDKYSWCPVGFFALKLSDPIAREAILVYAALTGDKELADDLVTAVETAEFA